MATTPWLFPNSCLTPQACWAFVGSNGSGKTALASALCGELVVRAGAVSGRVRAERLSFESQQQLGSWTGSGAIPTCWGRGGGGVSGIDPDAGGGGEEHEARALLARFGIESLWERPYRYLSSGRGASCCWPGPAGAARAAGAGRTLRWPGSGARASLMMLLADLVSEGLRLVVIVNRFDEIPLCHSPRPARRVSLCCWRGARGGAR